MQPIKRGVQALYFSARSISLNVVWTREKKFLLKYSLFFFSRLREEEDVFVKELLHFLCRVVLVFKVSKSLNSKN